MSRYDSFSSSGPQMISNYVGYHNFLPSIMYIISTTWIACIRFLTGLRKSLPFKLDFFPPPHNRWNLELRSSSWGSTSLTKARSRRLNHIKEGLYVALLWHLDLHMGILWVVGLNHKIWIGLAIAKRKHCHLHLYDYSWDVEVTKWIEVKTFFLCLFKKKPYILHKVRILNMITHHDQTRTTKGCVVRCKFKNKHQKWSFDRVF